MGIALFIYLSKFFSPQDNFLLFKVSSIVFVHQDEIQKVPDTKPVIHGRIRGRQVGWNARKRQLDGNHFPLDGGSVHNFVSMNVEKKRQRVCV